MGDLHHTYPATWPGRPQQMPLSDWGVWREFLARRGQEWTAYAYDVELHGGDTPVASPDPGAARAWARAIAKRADVIAVRASGDTIIEVRRRASHATLGQIQVYTRLFPADYPTRRLEGGLIACEVIDPDVRRVADQVGVAVWTTND
jgi:hypothetical protein